MTGVFSRSDGSTILRLVNGSNVIVAKLYQHKVTRLQAVIHLLPAALVQIRSTTATSHRSIHNINLRFVKDRIGYCTPAPHTILIFVSILHCTVTRNKHDRLSLGTCQVVHGQLHIAHHSFQWIQCWVVAGHNALSSRAGIHHRPKATSMYLV